MLKIRRAQNRRSRKPSRLLLPAAVAVLIVLSGTVLLFSLRKARHLHDAALQIYMLDVGHGDALLLRSDGHTALIDTGSAEVSGRLRGMLHDCGVKHLDCLINSHPHEDHMGGMAGIAEQLHPDVLYMPAFPEALTPTLSSFTALLETVREEHIPVRRPACGEVIRLGRAEIRFVFPDTADCTDLNGCSLGCVITCGKFSMFTAGDLDQAGEEALCSAGLLPEVTVMKCSHHGSSSSTPEVLLDALRPHAALISCGAGNDYGHPSRHCLSRLAERGIMVFRTDLDGTVCIETDGEHVPEGVIYKRHVSW